jgi:hypothetical protein
MKWCGNVEWVVTTYNRWRDMGDEEFEQSFESFEKALRAYRAQFAGQRQPRPAPPQLIWVET